MDNNTVRVKVLFDIIGLDVPTTIIHLFIRTNKDNIPFTQFTNLDFDQIKVQIKDFLRSNSNFTDFDFEGFKLFGYN